MKQVVQYQYTLSSTDDLQLTVGERTLTLSFRWPVAYQEQYDIFKRRVTAMASSDPLVEGTSYIRDYDWIDFYTNIPAFGDGMEEWWESATQKPQSLLHKTDVTVYQLLTQQKELASELDVYRTNLSRVLHWYVTIGDDLGATRTGVLHPGGWINNQDNNWSLRFISDLGVIGQDDIDKVTIEAETYEFV